MARHFAITIARTLGSDGGEIARRVAQKLNIRFIDKELLSLASSESGINEALFSKLASGSVIDTVFYRIF